MSCLSLTLTKAYTIMTGLFAIHQYVHMANDAIIGIETRYDTPINHRTIVFNDNKYTHCFTKNAHITNIVSYKADETYIIEDPTITFDIKLITTDVSHQPVIIDHMSPITHHHAHPHDTKTSHAHPHATKTHHVHPHADTHHAHPHATKTHHAHPHATKTSHAHPHATKTSHVHPHADTHHAHPHDTKTSHAHPHTTKTHYVHPHATKNQQPHPHTTPIPHVIRHSIININTLAPGQPIHVSQMSETSKTRCMEIHQDYYSRSWFSKLFYEDPCTQTDPIRVYKMVACVNTLSFSSDWTDSVNVAPSGGLTMLQQCSKKCDIFPYFSVGGGHCKCGPVAPPPSLSHEDCQPCYDDKEFTCGAGLYGLNSVYEFA